MFRIELDEALAILKSISKTLTKMDDVINELDDATKMYNATIS